MESAVKVLSYIIGMAGYGSVARDTGLPYAFGFFSLLLISIVFEYRRRFPVPRWLLTLASFALVGVTLLRMNLQNFVQPAVEALLILLVIKFLEEKKFRDYMQIYALSVFLLAGSTLLTLDIFFLVFFLGLVLLLSVSLVLLTYYVQDNGMELPWSTVRTIAQKSLYIPLVSIPLAVLLFIILPRTSSPVFRFLERGGGAAAGFSDSVRLGQVSSIQEDAAVLMRVAMDKVDDRQLYWRGIVLDYFDGATWKSTRLVKAGSGAMPTMPGRMIPQTIYLDPYGNSYLFALDKPIEVRAREIRSAGGQTFYLPRPVTRKMKYDAVSVASDILPDRAPDLTAYLQVPETGMEKVAALVHDIVPRRGAEERSAAVLRFLGSGAYTYSRKELPVSSKPLDDFLLRHKQGNCEYFASALAVMLRLSGIPARLVGGYRGGFYNEAGGYYLIPQGNAHVWVEAYFERRGWVRLDPTPASLESFVSPAGLGSLFRIRLAFDTMNYYWNAAVINYDLEKQFSLVRRMSDGLRGMPAAVPFNRRRAVRWALLVLGLAFAVLAGRVLLRPRKPVAERLLAAFLGKMKKHGYAKSRSQGLEEFVAAVVDDPLRDNARRFVDAFERIYYRDRPPMKEEETEMKKMIRAL